MRKFGVRDNKTGKEFMTMWANDAEEVAQYVSDMIVRGDLPDDRTYSIG